jgi:hypothetical protein
MVEQAAALGEIAGTFTLDAPDPDILARVDLGRRKAIHDTIAHITTMKTALFSDAQFVATFPAQSGFDTVTISFIQKLIAEKQGEVSTAIAGLK